MRSRLWGLLLPLVLLASVVLQPAPPAHAVTGADTLHLWNPTTGTTIPLPADLVGVPVKDAAAAANQLAVILTDGSLRIYDTTSGAPVPAQNVVTGELATGGFTKAVVSNGLQFVLIRQDGSIVASFTDPKNPSMTTTKSAPGPYLDVRCGYQLCWAQLANDPTVFDALVLNREMLQIPQFRVTVTGLPGPVDSFVATYGSGEVLLILSQGSVYGVAPTGNGTFPVTPAASTTIPATARDGQVTGLFQEHDLGALNIVQKKDGSLLAVQQISSTTVTATPSGVPMTEGDSSLSAGGVGLSADRRTIVMYSTETQLKSDPTLAGLIMRRPTSGSRTLAAVIGHPELTITTQPSGGTSSVSAPLSLSATAESGVGQGPVTTRWEIALVGSSTWTTLCPAGVSPSTPGAQTGWQNTTSTCVLPASLATGTYQVRARFTSTAGTEMTTIARVDVHGPVVAPSPTATPTSTPTHKATSKVPTTSPTPQPPTLAATGSTSGLPALGGAVGLLGAGLALLRRRRR